MKKNGKRATTEDTGGKTEHTENGSVKSVVARIEELESQVKRTLADYQNLEKRVAEEKREWISSANRELLLRILPILDTLMLATRHSEDQNLKISVAQFLDVLEGEGIEKIETVGKDFDPETMECVATEAGDPSAGSGQGENKVLEELQAGYMLRDKVLRVARVKVGKRSN